MLLHGSGCEISTDNGNFFPMHVAVFFGVAINGTVHILDFSSCLQDFWIFVADVELKFVEIFDGCFAAGNSVCHSMIQHADLRRGQLINHPRRIRGNDRCDTTAFRHRDQHQRSLATGFVRPRDIDPGNGAIRPRFVYATAKQDHAEG